MASHLLLISELPELVGCWHAATLSEKVFRKKYSNFKINKINVLLICEEILKILEAPRLRRKGNLYLLAQLMFGIMKIHSYQTVHYLKQVFQLEEKIHPLEDTPLPGDEIPIETDEFELVQEYLSREMLSLSDTQSITFEDYTHDYVQRRMIEKQLDENWLKLDVLTDEEIASFLSPRKSHEAPLDGTRKQVMDRSSQESDTDFIISEESFRSPQHSSDKKTRVELTPQKRHSHTRGTAETPTKRKRLTFGREAVPTEVIASPEAVASPKAVALPEPVAPSKAVALPEAPTEIMDVEPATRREEDVIQQQSDTDMDIPVVPQTKLKKRKFFDNKTSLNRKTWAKSLENPNIHCEKAITRLNLSDKTPAAKLLKEPATAIRTRLGRSLQQLFDQRAVLCVPRRYEEEEIAISPSLIRDEKVRGEETPSGIEKPSVLGKTGITTDSSVGNNVSNIPFVPPIESTLNVIPEIRETIASPEEPLDITKLIEITENTSIPPEDEQNQRSIRANTVETASSLASQKSLTSRELLTLLEVLWENSGRQNVATLDELISEEYSTEDRVTAFEILLDLHKQKKVTLRQYQCYDTLYIEKPPI